MNSIIEDAITAEDLLLDKEMLEDIVTELPEDELIITPEPVEEEEEENVEEEVVEEAEEEVEEQRFDFADLDDVEDANAEVEEILIDNPLSEENTRSYGPNMNAVSNNAVRDDFLAKEFGAPFAAGAAVAALAADNMPFAGDDFSNGEAADTGADFHNLTHIFMTHGHAQTDGFLCPLVPIPDMYICAANSGFMDLNFDIVRTYRRNWHLLHGESSLRLILDQCPHGSVFHYDHTFPC